jgi:hypothetical protein
VPAGLGQGELELAEDEQHDQDLRDREARVHPDERGERDQHQAIERVRLIEEQVVVVGRERPAQDPRDREHEHARALAVVDGRPGRLLPAEHDGGQQEQRQERRRERPGHLREDRRLRVRDRRQEVRHEPRPQGRIDGDQDDRLRQHRVAQAEEPVTEGRVAHGRVGSISDMTEATEMQPRPKRPNRRKRHLILRHARGQAYFLPARAYEAA